jgi:DNA-binding NtrC family response regulator
MRYAWPGYVTELENFVKSYLILGDDSLISKSDPAHRAGAAETQWIGSFHNALICWDNSPCRP